MNHELFNKYLKYKTKYINYKYKGGSGNTSPLYMIPPLCFGTVQGSTLNVKTNIKLALKNGYRHIDSAEGYVDMVRQHDRLTYFNAIKEGILEGLVENNLKRTDIWFTFKGDNLTTDNITVLLETLSIDYFDLFLVHHTCGTVKDYDVLKIFLDSKIIRYWGVSNCDNLEYLSEIKDTAIPGHPLYANQIQAVPYGIDIIGRDIDTSIDVVNEMNQLGVRVVQPVRPHPPGTADINDCAPYSTHRNIRWILERYRVAEVQCGGDGGYWCVR